VVTASGTRIMRDFVPDADATVVGRLRQAGAVIVGKTQLTEGAFSTHHPDINPPKNPWNQAHWPGVSSSGSGVSVAAGLAYAALGSDTGGSIRFPSASCGLVGIKPTFGRVSKHGAFPLAESLDHIGPMTRSVADAARMLQVIAGHDPADAATLEDPVPNYAANLNAGVRGLRLGVDWAYVETGVDPVVAQAVRDAVTLLEQLGADVREVTMPESYRGLVAGWSVTCAVECARAHGDFYPAREDDYGAALAALIRLGRRTSEADYAQLEEIRSLFGAQLDALLDEVDAIVTPCMPGLAPSLVSMDERSARQDQDQVELTTFTAPFDYSGHPTIALPAGLGANGLPKSIQLVGKRLGEATLMQIGQTFESEMALELRPIA
jgi:amidase